MHSHVLATLCYRVRNNIMPSSEPALRKIAAEKLALVSTGGSDWLDGSGEMTKVEGGFRFIGRKIFGSGAPAGDLLLTMGVYQDPESGPTVKHFAVNMHDPGVTVLEDWDTLGMRGTGSNTIQINDVFIPEAGISLSRPQGTWHKFFDIIAPIALPMVMSVYLGIAESARTSRWNKPAKGKKTPWCKIRWERWTMNCSSSNVRWPKWSALHPKTTRRPLNSQT